MYPKSNPETINNHVGVVLGSPTYFVTSVGSGRDPGRVQKLSRRTLTKLLIWKASFKARQATIEPLVFGGLSTCHIF